jgi:hypothetical protein
MVCSACGSPNPNTREFCVTCGARLDTVRRTPAEIKEELDLSCIRKPASVPKSKSLSVASLILGLVSLTPATFITGIPAVICGAVALKQRRPGFWQAAVGIATGAFGTFVLTLAMLLPLMARQRELTRVAAVQRNMHAFQAALEDHAIEHAGRYPDQGVSWEPGDDDGMVLHFKGSGQFPAGIPVNPYTGECYHRGKDFFYLPEDLAETKLNAVVDRTDARCPFAGLAAPEDMSGTIVILGWVPPEGRGSPKEYAVVGYSRATRAPLAGHNGRTFFVLHN